MINIRQATIQDLEKILELNQRVMAKIPSFDEDLVPNFTLTPQGKNYFREDITRPEWCFLIAEEGGRIIGYTNGGLIDFLHRKSRYFEIQNLGVIPEMQRKGLGKQLLESITSWAKEHGYQKIYLNCYAANEEALSFYRKNGYQDIDVCLEKKIE
ncbi:MAG: hypothetical protein COY80_02125 [Candidatus Pacebacteria bacterium CG_4_10_14_0_8_um_filter_42_14]|nr:MAG: hypothetical protein COY80_02125 [Candidatus Pacebacteria bacterium CG_4_10_14_0_8_um_filter_42_14]